MLDNNIDDQPWYWKFCGTCGKKLERQFTNSSYDKVTGEEYKQVIVFCGNTKDTNAFNLHAWGTYQSETLDIREIPF